MTVSSLLSQARLGDCSAIAVLINQQLQARGIVVWATQQNSGIQLRLQAAGAVPSQAPLLRYLERAFRQLDSPVIGQVKVVALQPSPGGSSSAEGRNPRTDKIAWQATIRLSPDAFPQAAPARILARPAAEPAASPPARPRPQPTQVLRQWAIASLGGTLLTGVIVSALFALLVPVFMGMTGLGQLSSFGWMIVLVLQFVVGLPLGGLLIGDAQTRVLRCYLPQVGGWRLATPLGFLLGFFIAIITHTVGHSLLLPGGVAAGWGPRLLAWGCTTVGVGLGFGFLGMAQSAVFANTAVRGHRWTVSTLVSGLCCWLVSLLLGFGLTQVLHLPQLDPTVISALVGGAIGWVLFNLSMAIAMAKLLCRGRSPQGLNSQARQTAARQTAHPVSRPTASQNRGSLPHRPLSGPGRAAPHL